MARKQSRFAPLHQAYVVRSEPVTRLCSFEYSSCDTSLDTTKIVADSISAGKPIITVTPNYRLNLFGFGDGKGTGEINLSLKDQALAIDWVRKHVSGFGGDPVGYTSFYSIMKLFSI